MKLLRSLQVLTILAAVALVRNALLSEHPDFMTFWKTGSRVLLLEPLYVPEIDGPQCLKYPPWIAPAFAPIALFSLRTAGIIWRLVQVGCLFWVLKQLAHGRTLRARIAMFAGFLSMIGIWNFNIWTGQITPAITALALLPNFGAMKSRWLPLSLLALSSKIFPLLAALGLGAHLRRRSLWLKTLAGAVILSIPALLSTPDHSVHFLIRSFLGAATLSGENLAGAWNGMPSLLGAMISVTGAKVPTPQVLAIPSTGLALLTWIWARPRLTTPLEKVALGLALSGGATPLAFTYGLGLAYPWFALRLADAAEQRFKSPRDWIAVAGLTWLILPLPYRALAPFLSVASVAAINPGAERG